MAQITCVSSCAIVKTKQNKTKRFFCYAGNSKTVLPLVVVEEHLVEITEASDAGNEQKKEEKHKKWSAAIPAEKSLLCCSIPGHFLYGPSSLPSSSWELNR